MRNGQADILKWIIIFLLSSALTWKSVRQGNQPSPATSCLVTVKEHVVAVLPMPAACPGAVSGPQRDGWGRAGVGVITCPIEGQQSLSPLYRCRHEAQRGAVVTKLRNCRLCCLQAPLQALLGVTVLSLVGTLYPKRAKRGASHGSAQGVYTQEKCNLK